MRAFYCLSQRWSLPDKHKVFEEYISLDGGERDTSLQPQRFSFSTDIEPLRSVRSKGMERHSTAYRRMLHLPLQVNVTHVWLGR
jgi:hypothetical protein